MKNFKNILALIVFLSTSSLYTIAPTGNTPYCVRSETEKTLFCKALEDGNIDYIKSRLTIYEIDDPIYGKTPLDLAIRQKNLASIQCVLSLGANINKRDYCSGQTALVRATEEGLAEIVSFLLAQKNIVIDAQDEHKNTAFSLAKSAKDPKILAAFDAYRKRIRESTLNAIEATITKSERFDPISIVEEYLFEK